MLLFTLCTLFTLASWLQFAVFSVLALPCWTGLQTQRSRKDCFITKYFLSTVHVDLFHERGQKSKRNSELNLSLELVKIKKNNGPVPNNKELPRKHHLPSCEPPQFLFLRLKCSHLGGKMCFPVLCLSIWLCAAGFHRTREFSELEGTHKDHGVQLPSEWSIQGSKP